MQVNPDKDRIDLTGSWTGYSLIRGQLVSPENRTFAPGDMNWWSLTCAIKHEWTALMDHLKADARDRRHARDTGIIWLAERAQAAKERREKPVRQAKVKVIVIDLADWQAQHFGSRAG